VPAPRGLGVEQLPSLCNRIRRTSGDRVGMDGAKTGTRKRQTLPDRSTPPLKPKPGLSGPPAKVNRVGRTLLSDAFDLWVRALARDFSSYSRTRTTLYPEQLPLKQSFCHSSESMVKTKTLSSRNRRRRWRDLTSACAVRVDSGTAPRVRRTFPSASSGQALSDAFDFDLGFRVTTDGKGTASAVPKISG
jgi:hypothetical protein